MTDPTPCVDCGTPTLPDTPPGSQDWQRYMVHDHVWQAAGMTPNGGWLCIPCLETRLGRLLTGHDLEDVPINHPMWKHSADDTPRLQHLKLQAALINRTRLWENELNHNCRWLKSLHENNPDVDPDLYGQPDRSKDLKAALAQLGAL